MLVFPAARRLTRDARVTLSLTPQVGLFAFRDPFGIRPLVLGQRSTEFGSEWCFASEDCAFSPLGFVKARGVAARRRRCRRCCRVFCPLTRLRRPPAVRIALAL